MRKKDDTLRDHLLECARNISDTEGIEAISIRSIAKSAGVAVGTVYNYFSNKDAILIALTEQYWKQTLIEMEEVISADTFCGQLEEIFNFLKERIDHSAGKLMHSLVKEELTGLERMMAMQAELEAALVRRMEQDSHISEEIWNENFTKQQYARFLLMNLTVLLKVRTLDISFLTEIVKRTICASRGEK